MPELPEVETIRRGLQAHLPGKRTERILVREPRLRWPVNERKLQKWIVGQTILRVDRRAKYLLIELQNQSTLIMHLGMSGKILLVDGARPPEKHDHIVFHFKDQSELIFRDTRRFGMVDVIPPGDLASYPRLAALGYEPLEAATDARGLYEKAKHSTRPIKNLLMDSHFIVGVGNIYANEALYFARVHPLTPSGQLSLNDWKRLLREIRRVLKKAIEKGGTTLNDFMDSNGNAGYFQLSLSVYGREGKKCRRCGALIQRVVLVGRSTYFCPECQKLFNP